MGYNPIIPNIMRQHTVTQILLYQVHYYFFFSEMLSDIYPHGADAVHGKLMELVESMSDQENSYQMFVLMLFRGVAKHNPKVLLAWMV